MQGKYIVITQADGSKWAVSLVEIEKIFERSFFEENAYWPVYGAHYAEFQLMVFAQSLTWAQVVNAATMIAPSPDGGPDYNWGWQHGDAEIQEITLPEITDDSEARLDEMSRTFEESRLTQDDEPYYPERDDNAWDDEPYTYHGAYDLDYE